MPDTIGHDPLSCSYADVHAVRLPDPERDIPRGEETRIPSEVVLAGGCFWGIQAVFQHVKGVLGAISGYAGGISEKATYDAVSTGTTGHAECVHVKFDPALVSLGQILKIFFSVAHDPTQLDGQGPDHGTQYRSAIFYTTPEQKEVADAYIKQLQDGHVYLQPIVTKIEPLTTFFPAEDYHQNYAALHPTEPYIATNDMPKVLALKKEFPRLFV